MTSSATITPKGIFQLKIVLAGIEPFIWRRVLAPGTLNLREFSDLIQIVMGWNDTHMHKYCTDQLEIIDADLPKEGSLNESDFLLSDLVSREGDEFEYLYDFGDNWTHRITLELIIPNDDLQMLPACIDGRRACPIDDCGGPYGYNELIRILSDNSNPDFEGTRRFLGGN